VSFACIGLGRVSFHLPGHRSRGALFRVSTASVLQIKRHMSQGDAWDADGLVDSLSLLNRNFVALSKKLDEVSTISPHFFDLHHEASVGLYAQTSASLGAFLACLEDVSSNSDLSSELIRPLSRLRQLLLDHDAVYHEGMRQFMALIRVLDQEAHHLCLSFMRLRHGVCELDGTIDSILFCSNKIDFSKGAGLLHLQLRQLSDDLSFLDQGVFRFQELTLARLINQAQLDIQSNFEELQAYYSHFRARLDPQCKIIGRLLIKQDPLLGQRFLAKADLYRLELDHIEDMLSRSRLALSEDIVDYKYALSVLSLEVEDATKGQMGFSCALVHDLIDKYS